MEPIDKLATLHGVPVVAFEEGLRLGRVHDVFIDKSAKRIQGISFRNRLWGKENEAYVDLSDILKMGRDVIIVSGQAAASPLIEDMTPSSLRQLKGFKITTRDGAWIGEVADLNVNRENGTISEIILKDDTLLEVDAEDIVLGPDVVVVPSHYVERITPPDTERKGLLGRVFGPAAVADSLRDKYEEIRASVGSGKGAEKMFETLRSGSEKTRKTVKRTSRRIQETLEQMRKSREREAPPVGEETDGYQGVEAEHAGRTYAEKKSDQPPQTAYPGPYGEGDRDTDHKAPPDPSGS